MRDNLALIQKLFKLRQCSDIFFSHRTRPCLQYQINRCTAPCVGFVSTENYHEQVEDAIHFLEGKNKTVMRDIEARMKNASEKKEYENAAHWRDVLHRLQKLQSQQFITGGKGNIDVFGAIEKMGQVAIAVVSIRNGQLIGHKTFFPNSAFDQNEIENFPVHADQTIQETLSAFIPQYYLNSERVSQSLDCIVLSHSIDDRLWIQNALQEIQQSKIKIITYHTRAFSEWKNIALKNAAEELNLNQSEKNNRLMKLENLQTILHLSKIPERIECFDISHTQGEATKASCVVFGSDGPIKKLYRQFNIENIKPGDDYAAMHQVLTRRYSRIKADNKKLPDIIIVDGGKGQMTQAISVLESLNIQHVILLGVAKGVTRKAGVEKIWMAGSDAEIALKENDPVRHFIQLIRDEAHRFAITAHRKAFQKKRVSKR